ncbi:MAG: hypothetical protein EA392_05920 [Cryomorphaceae bacterium]|nr:MAG: hypothetical protein EA392_05920 [Cryomorphaceae bacterium]
MKHLSLLATIVAGIGLLCAAPAAKAQHPCQGSVAQNTVWSNPNGALIFPAGGAAPVPEPLPIPPNAIQDVDYMGQQATNAHNAIHDQNGELLFFIVNGVIYEGEGYTIAEM